MTHSKQPPKHYSLAALKQRAIVRIHVAKKQLGMSDDDYRYMLEGVTGKNSSKALSLAELQLVEQHLKKLGFKVTHRSAKRMSPQSSHKPKDQKNPRDKLRAMWIDMARAGIVRDESENALEAWVVRMSAKLNDGRGIEKVAWLSDYLASRLVTQLKQWQKRSLSRHSREGGNPS